jgi:hypothetical protein
MKEAPKANQDFTRLKLAEGLVPLLAEVDTPDFPQNILEHIRSNEKDQKRFMESLMVLDLQTPDHEKAYFTFPDLIRSKKSFFSELLEQY